MKFLRVPPDKWRKYQHYHDDRDVIWIKLYTSLLDVDSDVNYSLLADASKLLLHHLWMLAARTKNRIPYNKSWISKTKLNLRSTLNLKPLLAVGFVEIFEDGLEGFLVPELEESLVSHACLESGLISFSRSTEGESEGKPVNGFDALWAVYPRKRGRDKAHGHYRAQVGSEADRTAIEGAIANYRREVEILGVEDRYVLHGSTFFNNRWRDYVDGVWSPPKAAGRKETFDVNAGMR